MTKTKHLLVYIFTSILCVFSGILGYIITASLPGLSNVLISLSVALGPVSVLGIIYEHFLFDEIREGAKQAFLEELGDTHAQLAKVLDDTRRLNEHGFLRIYSLRSEALNEVEEWLAVEAKEVFIVGTSLRGLLGEGEKSSRIRELFREKQRNGVSLKFLLIHPAFAVLREEYESVSRRPDNSVAHEVFETVITLRNLGIPHSSIKFFLGTPTCFGIKTSRYMLLNPYSYQDQALRSFCAVVSKDLGRGTSIKRTRLVTLMASGAQ